MVLPELDGRIFAGAASFKQVETADPEVQLKAKIARLSADLENVGRRRIVRQKYAIMAGITSVKYAK